jgi:hypothetical protein
LAVGPKRRRSGEDRPRFDLKKPLPPLLGEPLKPVKVRGADKPVGYQVILEAGKLSPGTYLLHAEVRDPTDWVVREDWKHLLVERRSWQVEVK